MTTPKFTLSDAICTCGNIARYIAALLWSASMDIPRPEFHRHELARRDLLRAMRGIDMCQP